MTDPKSYLTSALERITSRTMGPPDTVEAIAAQTLHTLMVRVAARLNALQRQDDAIGSDGVPLPPVDRASSGLADEIEAAIGGAATEHHLADRAIQALLHRAAKEIRNAERPPLAVVTGHSAAQYAEMACLAIADGHQSLVPRLVAEWAGKVGVEGQITVRQALQHHIRDRSR